MSLTKNSWVMIQEEEEYMELMSSVPHQLSKTLFHLQSI